MTSWASALNRIFGLQTQWGLRLSLRRLRGPDAMTLLECQGMPAVWRRSIAEALDVSVDGLMLQVMAPATTPAA